MTNAGVPFEQNGNGTYVVLAALLLGKPLGIVAFAYGAGPRAAGCRRACGGRTCGRPTGGGHGFTVALRFATAVFPAGALRDETTMGALLSFGAAPLALLASRPFEGPPRGGERPSRGLELE